MVNFYAFFVAASGATIETVVDHINHIREVAGVDHVGIGGDYDGVDVQPVGLEDVSKYPDLFDLLASPTRPDVPAWTAEELKKLAGENLLRVMRGVEQVARDMADVVPIETLIPDEEIYAHEPNQSCKTDYTYTPPSTEEPFVELA